MAYLDEVKARPRVVPAAKNCICSCAWRDWRAFFVLMPGCLGVVIPCIFRESSTSDSSTRCLPCVSPAADE